MNLLLRLTLALSMAALSWIFGGGVQGLVTLALYVVGVSVGLPFGFLLFGRGGAAWASGALIGYGLLSLAFWIPIAVGWVRPGAFFYLWIMLLLLGGTMRSVCKGITPLVPLPEWTTKSSGALLLVLHLVPLLAGLGPGDFSSDVGAQMALASDLARFEPDLAAPDAAGLGLTCDRTHFLPATVIGTRGQTSALAHVEGAVKTSAVMSALLLLAMISCVAWAVTGRAWAALAASALAVLAASFEAFWPPHAMAVALGLIAVAASSRGRIGSVQGVLFVGLALGLSVMSTPVLGAIASAVYGATVLWQVTARRLTIGDGARHALAGVPVALALAWCWASR